MFLPMDPTVPAMAYAASSFFSSFLLLLLFVCFPLIRQKIVGRRFLMATGSVNSCHFRAHDFSPHHSNRGHLRHS